MGEHDCSCGTWLLITFACLWALVGLYRLWNYWSYTNQRG
jgi:hypothetical protein